MYETIRNIMQFITSVNTVTFRTNTVMYKSDTVVIDWQYRRRKSRNVHKLATTDVNDQIYVCRTNLIQTLLQQLNMHARAANYTRFTQITTHNQMYIIPHNAAKSCSPRARPLSLWPHRSDIRAVPGSDTHLCFPPPIMTHFTAC